MINSDILRQAMCCIANKLELSINIQLDIEEKAKLEILTISSQFLDVNHDIHKGFINTFSITIINVTLDDLIFYQIQNLEMKWKESH